VTCPSSPGGVPRPLALGWLDEARFVGDDDQLRAVMRTELGQQRADVGLDGGHGDVQGVRDLGVGQAAGDQAAGAA
jgi:hypothetical protein